MTPEGRGQRLGPGEVGGARWMKRGGAKVEDGRRRVAVGEGRQGPKGQEKGGER